MRARTVALCLCIASALSAYACSSTFPSALPYYDADAGPPLSEDSGQVADAALADAQVADAGDAGPAADAGDSGSKSDAGDSGEPTDAGDGGG